MTIPFDFDDLGGLGARVPPEIHFGTSSWNYPGWRGIVYDRAYPATGAGARMLAEYARHPLFSTVGIDAGFYRPLAPQTLAAYAAALPAGFRCVNKVWSRITVHTFAVSQGTERAGERNPDFLNAALFHDAVLAPYQEHFADHLGPFVFEFQQIPNERYGLPPEQFAESLGRFFAALPSGPRYSVEIRNAEFLFPGYFAVLNRHHVAHCFNSWTRMPAIGAQLALPGAITADCIVARALLRPGRSHAAEGERLKPFDRIREEYPQGRADLLRLAGAALDREIPAYILVGNRLEGCSPRTVEGVVRRLLA